MSKIKELLLVIAVCAVVGTMAVQNQNRPSSSAGTLQLEGVPQTERSLVLVRLDPDQRMTAWAKKELEDLLGVRVRLATLEIPDSMANPKRNQIDADEITRLLAEVERKDEEAVIALTSRDIFLSSQPNWRYCFGSHGRHGAVLSSARMGVIRFDGEPASRIGKDRLRKMLLRYTLETVHGLKRNQDPSSLLFGRVLGPRDLDTMELRL